MTRKKAVGILISLLVLGVCPTFTVVAEAAECETECGTWYESAGNPRIHYPEFSAENGGVIKNHDAEYARNFFGSISYGGFTLEGLYGRRDKELPNAPYGAVFSDKRNELWDERAYAELRYAREFADDGRVKARAYFDQIRKARAAVKIPDNFLELREPLMVTPDEVEEAFVKANPGLTRAGVAVTCDSRRLNEVRVCMTKDLKFQECAEVDRRACRRDKVVMPPVRRSEARASQIGAVAE